MAITAIDMGEIADVALPVEELAVQMRLADGVLDDPVQSARLLARLRAAVDEVERRTGLLLFARQMTLAGSTPGARRVRLPVRPVAEVVDAFVLRAGSRVSVGPVTMEEGPAEALVVLAQPVRDTEHLMLDVVAGYESWGAVPASLRQAVLLIAEALDAGDGEILSPMAASLLAPFRRLRIGGGA